MTSTKYSKSDRIEHKKPSKSEKQYVRGIIHNLSLSRWTDQEIVDYLHDEKKIEIARSTVNGIKNQIEKEARKWYLELQFSRYKYLASYKERLDSLFSYQKKLNEIIEFYIHEHLYPDTVIRAIVELHSIELSISNLFKNLPSMHLEDDEFAKYIQPKILGSEFEPWNHPKGIQCSTCGRWMMNKEMLKVHDCLPEPVI